MSIPWWQDDTPAKAEDSNDTGRSPRDRLSGEGNNELNRSVQEHAEGQMIASRVHSSNKRGGGADRAEMRRELKDSTAEISQIRHLLK